MNKGVVASLISIVLAAGGYLYLSTPAEQNGKQFAVAAQGGGEVEVGKRVSAGFTIAYTGTIEGYTGPGNLIYIHETTAEATGVLTPAGSKDLQINDAVNLNEPSVFYTQDFECTEAGAGTITFSPIIVTYELNGEAVTADADAGDEYWLQTEVAVTCVEPTYVEIAPPTLSIPAGQ